MDQTVLSVGVVGNGFVGKATSLLLVERAKNSTGTRIKLFVYDASPSLCNPPGTTLNTVANCDLVFVCVPTPMLHTGACDTSIVESAVAQLRAVKPDCNIVVRSTVPPGTSQRLEVSFMPEFLTEKAWAEDVYSCETWVFGFDSELGRSAGDMIETILKNARSAGYISSARIASVSTMEAEMIKYTRNTFLATKVALFNEINALCKAKTVDFEMVRTLVVNDQRIGVSHTAVPGHDGKRGFGGTCLPKDLSALIEVYESNGVACPVLKAVRDRNNELDRPEQDWYGDIGRAVSANSAER
jgi:UDPglucose 6-dehydrogenase